MQSPDIIAPIQFYVHSTNRWYGQAEYICGYGLACGSTHHLDILNDKAVRRRHPI
jgi:hypothetical protein